MLERYKIAMVLKDLLTADGFQTTFSTIPVSVSITVGGVTSSIPVITWGNLKTFLTAHYSWDFLSWQLGDDEVSTDYSKDSYAFSSLFTEYMSRHEKQIADFIADLYVKHIDPMASGWSHTQGEKVSTNSGGVTRYMYEAGTSYAGKKHTISVAFNTSTPVSVSADVSDGVAQVVTNTSQAANGVTTGSGKQATISNDYSASLTDGTTRQTKLQNGTFDSEATGETPVTALTTELGTTGTANESISDNTQTNVGSSTNDHGVMEKVINDASNTTTDDTTIQTANDRFIELAKSYLDFDWTFRLLKGFADEQLFLS